MKTWTTRDGKELHIKNMSKNHLENCIKYLEENPISYGCYGVDADDMFFDVDEKLTNRYIRAFKKELKNRK